MLRTDSDIAHAEQRARRDGDQHRREDADAAGDRDGGRIGADGEEHDLAEIDDAAIADLEVEADGEDEGDAGDRQHVDRRNWRAAPCLASSVDLAPEQAAGAQEQDQDHGGVDDGRLVVGRNAEMARRLRRRAS